jgi:hemerythrin-like domain-containing protein
MATTKTLSAGHTCEMLQALSLIDKLNSEIKRLQGIVDFQQAFVDEIKHHEAAELANLAGKMINSAKVQIEYYALRKQVPNIDFLASESIKK